MNPKLILAFCLLTSTLTAQGVTSFAVLDFEGRGIANHEAASLTDWLRTEIARVGSSIPLVERGAMIETLIQEQDLGLLDCTSEECVVEIGQLLQVSHMVAGSIGQVGSTYTITARTIDVESGRIVKIINRRYQGPIDGLFDEMTPIAWEIVGKETEYNRIQQSNLASQLAAEERSDQSRQEALEIRQVRERRANAKTTGWALMIGSWALTFVVEPETAPAYAVVVALLVGVLLVISN